MNLNELAVDRASPAAAENLAAKIIKESVRYDYSLDTRKWPNHLYGDVMVVPYNKSTKDGIVPHPCLRGMESLLDHLTGAWRKALSQCDLAHMTIWQVYEWMVEWLEPHFPALGMLQCSIPLVYRSLSRLLAMETFAQIVVLPPQARVGGG